MNKKGKTERKRFRRMCHGNYIPCEKCKEVKE